MRLQAIVGQVLHQAAEDGALVQCVEDLLLGPGMGGHQARIGLRVAGKAADQRHDALLLL